jgi:hypothetical protein
VNRAKSFRRKRLRADVLSLASNAMASLRELVSGPNVPPSVRFRASLAILDAANGLKSEAEIEPDRSFKIQNALHTPRILSRLA